MTRFLKVTALIGAILIALGVLLSLAGFAAGGAAYLYHEGRGVNLLGRHFGTSGSAVSEEKDLAAFHAIQINGALLNVELQPSDEGKYAIRLEYSDGLEPPKFHLTDDGTLSVRSNWRDERLNLGSRVYGVTILYPEGASFDALDVDLNVSNLSIREFSADSAVLEMNVGNLEGERFDTGRLEIETNVGNVEISGVLRGETMVSSNVGSVTLNPSLSPDSYYIENHMNGQHHTLGSQNAPNRITIDANLGSGEVSFDD